MSEVRYDATSVLKERAACEDALRAIRHDLRHSLYVVGLAVELLEDSRADDQKFAEVIEMVRKERSTMEELVDRLLQLVSVAQAKAD